MAVEMVLTIISKDRPGLVQTLAQVIADHSGNWIDSSMARLGGEFAGILRVDVSERTVASFEKSLAALAEHGIAVTVRRDSAIPRSHGRRVHLNLTGTDHPGIVREVSSALAGHRVSIDELHTEVRPGSMTGVISLRLGERQRQRLASFNTRGSGPSDVGQRASGPVFRLNEVENFTILRKTGDEARRNAA
jgi:glycine cleavage system regulatory protein